MNSNGVQGNQVSRYPSISGDGRFVAFESVATNLVSGDNNFRTDVFVHDRQTGETTRVSVDSNGFQGTGNSSRPSMSWDGRHVTFESLSGFVSGDSGIYQDVFVHDLQTGETTRVSEDSNGMEGNGTSSRPAISGGGRYVTYHSFANNLVPGDVNSSSDVFVADRGETFGISQIGNISTRGFVGTGANVKIGGFILEGFEPKTVLIRAQGPSLVDFGVTGVLANPTMHLYFGSTVIAQNNDWQNTDPMCLPPAVSCGGSAEIIATGLDPCTAATTGCTLDSAIYITLPPGNYTAIVSGVGGGTGVGLVGVFDVDTENRFTTLSNISTRGFVGTGPDVQIAGFIIAGNTQETVLVRAQGPSLVDFGVTGVLANPTMQLYSGSTVIAQNNDWQNTDPMCLPPAVSCGGSAEIIATGLDPCTAATTGCTLDSAIYIILPPGNYTAIVSGVGGGTGVGLVGMFDVD